MHQTSWPNWLATSPLIATWVLLHIGEVPLPLEVTSKPYFGGQGWIRTTVLFTEEIYSLPPSTN